MPKVMAGMSYFAPLLLFMLLAVAASAEVPEAYATLKKIEQDVGQDVANHVAYLPFPHKVQARLSENGALTVHVDVTTNELPRPHDADELGLAVSKRLVEHLAARWPRIALAPGSRLVVKRPFSFTDTLPELRAPLEAPRVARKIVAPARPASKRTAPGRLAPNLGVLNVEDPKRGPVTREANDLKIRIARTFGRRWIVTQLSVGIPEPKKALVKLRITAVSQGSVKDRERLRRATVELDSLLKIAGRYTAAPRSLVRFDLYEGEAGKQVGKLEADFANGWSIDGEVPVTVSLGPKALTPAAPRPVEQRKPRPGSVVDRHIRAAKHPPPPPRPDPEQSGAHRPMSTEDLVEVPGSVVGPRGSSRFRTRVSLRQIDPRVYSAVGNVETLSWGNSISVVTAPRVQATFAFAHLRQTTDYLPPFSAIEQTGDAITFSLKYQTPSVLKRHAHLAVGMDVLLHSRRDDAFRVPDDYEQADSVWATYNLWTSPISLVHFMLKRVSLFDERRDFTQLAIAQELLPHHPLRRAYWELVYDDRSNQVFPVVGRAASQPLALNVGVEFGLGKRSALIFNVPHALSPIYQEAIVMLTTRL